MIKREERPFLETEDALHEVETERRVLVLGLPGDHFEGLGNLFLLAQPFERLVLAANRVYELLLQRLPAGVDAAIRQDEDTIGGQAAPLGDDR